MKHIEQLAEHGQRLVGGKTLLARATGRFYTPEILAEQLAHALIESAPDFSGREVRIIDPFCGDGRLVVSFRWQVANSRSFRKARFLMPLRDTDKEAVAEAETKIRALACAKKIVVKVDARAHDTFLNSTEALGTYDIALTNPPWEALKPDRRELDQMDADSRVAFEKTLRAYDTKLAKLLPNSQPEAKYSGWGTNLSRCGLELSVLLLKPDGLCGIVLLPGRNAHLPIARSIPSRPPALPGAANPAQREIPLATGTAASEAVCESPSQWLPVSAASTPALLACRVS